MAWRDREQHHWRGLRSYRAWLLGIAKNRIRNAAERMDAKKRGGDHEVETFSSLLASRDGSVSALLPACSTTPSRMAGRAERAAVMEAALRSLPPELEEIVRLRFFEQLSTSRCAERLGIPLSTAKKHVFRGATLYRLELKENLSSIPGDEDRGE